jgi:integrase
MATIVKLSSGRWRAQIRKDGHVLGRTFTNKNDAKAWSIDREREIERGETPRGAKVLTLTTFGDLVDLHISDMKEVGKAPKRSKESTLRALKQQLGSIPLKALTRERIVEFGRKRARGGAGPMTLGVDIGYIKLVVQHAAAVHGVPTQVEPVDLARVALKRLGLVGKSKARDRRPTEEEIERLAAFFDAKGRQVIPMGRIIKFAVATAMRQEEICRVTWSDYNERTKMLMVRDRKDPRHKDGNDQRIPLLSVSGYDPIAIIEEQRATRRNGDVRIFPVNHKSVSCLFTRACVSLGIEDLHFHDLRHEATSRLFEAGFTIEQVALVTGHKDWKMLKRYTHLRPEALHSIAAARVA